MSSHVKISDGVPESALKLSWEASLVDAAVRASSKEIRHKSDS